MSDPEVGVGAQVGEQWWNEANGRHAPRAGRLVRIRWLFPYIELAVALAAGGLWYLQGGAVWYTGPWPGPWPAIALAAVWIVRVFVVGLPVRPSVFDVWLWVFVAAAGLGVWTAYDRGPAWAKFWLVIGAVGIYYAIAHQPDRHHLYIVLALLALFGAAVAIYYLTTNDWQTMTVKVPVLVSVGERISSWLPAVPGHRMHPNVVGGILAAVIPLTVPLMALPRRDRRSGFGRSARRSTRALGIVSLSLAGLGLLLSMSRGAWLAAVGTAAVWLAWRAVGHWVRGRERPPQRAWGAQLIAAAGLLLVVLALAAVGTSLVLAGRLPGTVPATNRLNLVRSSLLLAGDTVFTGAGLGMFPTHFSIYTLLIGVRYSVHSHNMGLNLLIEQGALGLVSYLLMAGACIVTALRRLPSAGRGRATIIEAGLASLAVIVLHGLVDDPLYGARAVVLLFVPFGVVMAAAGSHSYDPKTAAARRRERWRWWVVGLVLTAVLIVAMIALLRPALSRAYANAGALAQARVELAAYDPDQWDDPTIDEVRQQHDLDHAIGLFGQAVAFDPGNRTARQRLAAIALARAQYKAGLTHMQAAWAAGHRDDVTRLLLADALVATGQPERAVETVRGLPRAEPRLMEQGWYRYWLNEDYRRAADAWRAVLLLNPDNEDAAAWQAEAERRTGE